MTRRFLDGRVGSAASAPWSLAALIAVVLIAGCTTTAGGHGHAAAANEHPFSIATSAPTVAATASATSQPAPSTATPTTTSPATSTPTTSTPTTTAPAGPAPGASRAVVAAQLARLTPGQRRVIVALARTGTAAVAEAATYDQAGHVTFWRYSTSWSRAGASTYPYDTTFVTQPSVVITGAVLTGMTDATFIARGLFSGDSSANAVAYTTGAQGWGAIKAEPNGNIGPSGRGVGFSAIGLANEFYFAHGLLESADCSDTLPIAGCGGNQRVLKFWRWAGHDFVLHSRAGLSH